MRKLILSLGLSLTVVGCAGANADSDSEVAASVVGGAVNNTSGSSVGFYLPRKSFFDKAFELVNPISIAHAADWSCTGGTLDPSYLGSAKNPYIFTPLSCKVTYSTGQTASSLWSSTFTLNYDSACETTHALIWNQNTACSVTRTTAIGGNTRTVTGPNGTVYKVTHDTNGAGTGWDATVSPAPTNAGLVVTCASGGCAEGASLVLNGSHITGTVAAARGAAVKEWDHTLTTDPAGLIITGSGLGRSVSGTVTVQHNLGKYVATATFNKAVFGDPLCCFPTSGSVSTTFTGGSVDGKKEQLTFTNACGEATLLSMDGSTQPVTMLHCL